MKNKFLIPIMGFACLLLGMTSGGIRNTPPAPSVVTNLLEREDNVKIVIKNLSSDESEKYLKRDVLDLGYRAVEVTIENGSADPYAFSESSIDLPLASAKEVAKATRKGDLPRSIALRVAGFFFSPFGIVGSIDSIMTNKSYRKARKQLESKAVREETVAPYSTIQRIFFIKSDSDKNSFTVSLENTENLETKVFPVEGFLDGTEKTAEALPAVSENYYLTHETNL